ncbi:hypothetical protein LJC63_05030 [Ruminococcaceae bacterium OttesenSCG-928-L11]|nr:hypothetical protein [Ruminococcaceae bacterium OttesenSCG-928-L11]
MRKLLYCFIGIALMTTLFTGCQNAFPQVENPNLSKTENIYAMSVKYTAENEGAGSYLEIAQRSDALFRLLEENTDAFVMDAYNYQSIDNEGTMVYTQNTLSLPIEIDAGGYCIRVSKNYFKFNPIVTVSGETIESRMISEDNTLNILVPEKYKTHESDIIAEYLELFYFEKVEVDNIHLEETQQPLSEITPNDLSVNIIYVKDGQDYFTYRTDLAQNTQNMITDPIVVLYTGNIHVSYAHSLMSQFVYFFSEETTSEAAYACILPYIQQLNAEDSFQKVSLVKELFLN